MSSSFNLNIKHFKRLWRRWKKRLGNPWLYPLYFFILFVGTIYAVFPGQLGDFLWRYYWGPVVADAKGGYASGISEGYNPVSTGTYTIFLLIAIYLIYFLFKKLGISLNFRAMIAFTPLIIAGAFSRVLEDSGLLREPGIYLFISPLLYLWLGFLGIFILLYSEFLEKKSRYEGMILSIIPYALMVRLLWFLMGSIEVGENTVFFLFIIFLYSSVHFLFVKRKDFERDSSIFLYSMFFMTLISYYLSFAVYKTGIRNPYVIPIVLSVSISLSIIIYFISLKIKRTPLFANAVNILLIFSQTMDGVATYSGVGLSYGEKHVLPSFLISLPSGPLLFLVVKISLAISVIYILDVTYTDSLDDRGRNLIKFALIIIALGPGIRDMLRVSMGI